MGAGPHIKRKLLAKRVHNTLISTSRCLKQVDTFRAANRARPRGGQPLALRERCFGNSPKHRHNCPIADRPSAKQPARAGGQSNSSLSSADTYSEPWLRGVVDRWVHFITRELQKDGKTKENAGEILGRLPRTIHLPDRPYVAMPCGGAGSPTMLVDPPRNMEGFKIQQSQISNKPGERFKGSPT